MEQYKRKNNYTYNQTDIGYKQALPAGAGLRPSGRQGKGAGYNRVLTCAENCSGTQA